MDVKEKMSHSESNHDNQVFQSYDIASIAPKQINRGDSKEVDFVVEAISNPLGMIPPQPSQPPPNRVSFLNEMRTSVAGLS